MSRNRKIAFGIMLLAGIFFLCCFCLPLSGGIALFRSRQPVAGIAEVSLTPPSPSATATTAASPPIYTLVPYPTSTPTLLAPPSSTSSPSATDSSGSANRADIASPITDTMTALLNAVVPASDLRDLAGRFRGLHDIPVSEASPKFPLVPGTHQSFWVNNVDGDENVQIDATLQYVTDHVYFWVEDGARFQKSRVKQLSDVFERQIYPRDREFFGSEWTPGVDEDEHLYILYAKNVGEHVAGYYSSIDEYTPLVNKYSNVHEMFILNAAGLDLRSTYALSVLAHEFQHMIHWHQDSNEETWLQEGLSELAAFLNGYTVGGADAIYVQDPDIQFTIWPDDLSSNTPYYGAAYLFLTYFLDRFGEQATQAIVASQANGMASIDQVLHDLDIRDPVSQQPILASDVFVDWSLASLLQDPSIADGRYTYHNYPQAPQPEVTETVHECNSEANWREVNQFGVDYIDIRCPGDYTLEFNGIPESKILKADPHSGSYAFWSNQGDESDMTVTRLFDFRDVTGPLSLNYWTWYDLEDGYDYVYLAASTNGEDWQTLTTPSGTAEDPSGSNFGWAYTGENSYSPTKWIEEKVDLSQYAGQQVYLRFEYVTDAAVNRSGFMVDDISIPEIGYSTDFEQDDGGWSGNGFVRIQNALPQKYALTVIRLGKNPSVERIDLPASNQVSLPFQIGGDTRRIVLVVSGITPFTGQKAPYKYTITPQVQ